MRGNSENSPGSQNQKESLLCYREPPIRAGELSLVSMMRAISFTTRCPFMLKRSKETWPAIESVNRKRIYQSLSL